VFIGEVVYSELDKKIILASAFELLFGKNINSSSRHWWIGTKVLFNRLSCISLEFEVILRKEWKWKNSKFTAIETTINQ